MRIICVAIALALAVPSCGSNDGVADTAASASGTALSVTTTSTNPPTTTATTTTADAAATTIVATTTTTLGPNAVTLRGDGLGVVSFGEPVDDVLAGLEETLGPPSDLLDSPEDIDTSDDTFFYGGPDMTEVLAIWRPVGLFVAFSRYPFYRDDGVLHFSGWANTPSDSGAAPLQTEAGVGVGSTYDEAKRAYGDRLVMNDDVCGPIAYLVPEGEDEVSMRIGLAFERSATESHEALIALHAGASPGC